MNTSESPHLKQQRMRHLSREQEACIHFGLAGESIFITGGAGTGKSASLQELVNLLKRYHAGNPKAVAVLAPTGIAALNVGGTTIHSWAKLPILGEKQAATHCCAKDPWLAAQVIVLDEISMVSDWMLDLLDRAGRRYRNSKLPFGGIQMIFCGDFLQLPPVEGRLCFHSEAWKALAPHTFELTYAFRQGSDAEFAALLAEIRMGSPSDETLKGLMQNNPAAAQRANEIVPTKLYPMTKDVDAENNRCLKQLPGQCYAYTANDQGPESALKKASSWTNAPAHLKLKIGAQVVLLKNLDLHRGLVNGSRGIVTGFTDLNEPVVRFAHETRVVKRETWSKVDDHGIEQASRTQYPLMLAWALTIHKSQGMSLDYVHVDMSGAWSAPGMAYVGLSRCRTLGGLSLRGLTKDKISAHPDALAFYGGERPQKKTKSK